MYTPKIPPKGAGLYEVLPVTQNRKKAFIKELRKHKKEFKWRAPRKSEYSYFPFMVMDMTTGAIVGGFILSGFSYEETDFHFVLSALFVKEEYRGRHIFRDVIIEYVKRHYYEYEIIIGASLDNLVTQGIYNKYFGKPCVQTKDAVFYKINNPHEESEGTGLYEVNEPVIYQNGDRFELGIVKKVCNGGFDYFVNYHTGDTAAKTNLEHLHKIANKYAFHVIRLDPDDKERR